jgi:two-component system nitrogen regulation response regulator GlnG
LRERGDDIVLLLDRIYSLYARQFGKEVQGIAPDALKLLIEYPWPGNVREMQSAVRRALLQTTGPVLLAESLPEEIRTGSRRAGQETAGNGVAGNLERLIDARLQAKTTDLYAETLAVMETCLLTRVLKATGGNQSQAARILGITRGSLRNKIHALNIHISSTVLLDEEAAEAPAPAEAVSQT